jgi:hypothetical protein
MCARFLMLLTGRFSRTAKERMWQVPEVLVRRQASTGVASCPSERRGVSRFRAKSSHLVSETARNSKQPKPFLVETNGQPSSLPTMPFVEASALADISWRAGAAVHWYAPGKTVPRRRSSSKSSNGSPPRSREKAHPASSARAYGTGKPALALGARQGRNQRPLPEEIA